VIIGPYVPVKPVEVPENKSGLFGWAGKQDWIKNDIDQFIYKKLDEEGMKPSPGSLEGRYYSGVCHWD
jgi:hypothetical protein